MERRTRLGITISLLLAVSFLSFPSSAVGRAHRSARRLRWRGDDLETFLGIDVVDRSDIPFAFDTLGHATLWFGVAVLVLWMVTPATDHRHPHLRRFWTALGLIGVSALIEIGQGVLTANRNAQWTDFAANVVGVSMGFVLVTLAMRAVVTPWRRRVAARAAS